MMFGWGCRAGPTSEPLRRRGLAEVHCGAGQAMSRCAVHLHSLGREHNLGLKSLSQYPSPRPFTPQKCETCRFTLPIGTLAEGRHTHIYTTRLDRWKLPRARACMGVFSTHWLGPGIMSGLRLLGDDIRAHSTACAFRDETSPEPTIEHGTRMQQNFRRILLKS